MIYVFDVYVFPEKFVVHIFCQNIPKRIVYVVVEEIQIKKYDGKKAAIFFSSRAFVTCSYAVSKIERLNLVPQKLGG